MAIKAVLIALFFTTNAQAQTKPDSAMIYYKKYVLYQALFNQELAYLNKFKNPRITKKLLNFQDSTVKYMLLLDKYKSK